MEDYISKLSEEVNMPTNRAIGTLDVSPPNEIVDYSDAFTTEEIFPTRDELLNWARGVGRQNGFVVVTLRSDMGGIGRKTILTLGCERSGKYRQYKNELARKATGTKKCECPFKLRGRPLRNGDGWRLNVVCGFHNHEVATTLVGYAYAGRLSAEENSLLCDMTKNMVKPRNILLTLKGHDEDNVSTIKHIYNARQAYRSSQRGPRTEMQHLIKLMDRDQYVYWHRRDDTSDVVRDIFWTHSDAIKLLNAFHIVLIIDSTYKTNKYRLPLLEIVGVTSTDLTFSAAFAYLESERADNFAWALEKVRGLIIKDDSIPQVIVTDRDIALMNAVHNIFPSSTHLLCQFHITKNVKAKCKLLVHPRDKWDLVMNAWDSIMWAPNEGEYMERWRNLEDVCSHFPIFLDYVKNTWLIPHKEKFVAAWIDRVMHLGNTTTNRVESAHGRLKNLLQDSRGDLCSCWDAMNNMIILQHTEIKASFERSITVVEHRFNSRFYLKLRGFVSRTALSHIANQYDRVNSVGVNSSICGCTLRTTHGLPCACELARYISMSYFVPLLSVHDHWKRLCFADQGINAPFAELSLQLEVDALLKRFQELDIPGKITLKSKVRELAFPDTTSMCPPPEKVRTKGAQKGNAMKLDKSTKRDPSYFEHVDALQSVHDSTSTRPSCQASVNKSKRKKVVPLLDQFHVQIQPHIERIVDVQADGNCGYRAIAALLGRGEESWPLIRVELMKELQEWHVDYSKLFGSDQRVKELRESLLVNSGKKVSEDKWMTIPDMGYVIASRYNVVLVHLSIHGCMTFFPLRGRPPLSQSSHRIISIGFVHNCHFVQVFLKNESPLPPTALQWHRYCYVEARSWEIPYITRIQSFFVHTDPEYMDITMD